MVYRFFGGRWQLAQSRDANAFGWSIFRQASLGNMMCIIAINKKCSYQFIVQDQISFYRVYRTIVYTDISFCFSRKHYQFFKGFVREHKILYFCVLGVLFYCGFVPNWLSYCLKPIGYTSAS